jgi:hypothetical protein
VIAVTIFADKRVFAKEIETFLKMSEKVQRLRNSDDSLSEAKLLSWFDSNSAIIRDKIQTPKFESWFYGCLDRLNGLYDMQAIIDIMSEIAKSDDDFHISEQALIVLTANHWNVEYRL